LFGNTCCRDGLVSLFRSTARTSVHTHPPQHIPALCLFFLPLHQVPGTTELLQSPHFCLFQSVLVGIRQCSAFAEWPVTQYRALEAPPRLLGGCELSFVCDGFTWPLCGHDCGSPVHCRDRGCPRAHRISAVPKPGGRSRSRETRRIQVIRCAGFLCVESLFLQHCSEETLVAPLYQGSKTTPTLGR
jgi:hypothetical protein